MDIITLARGLGHAIQDDETYLKLDLARQASDEDEVLQDLIGKFNLNRMIINEEASKPERDEEKLKNLNTELRNVYSEILSNESMKKYNEAKKDIDSLINRVNAIISAAVNGEDPDAADYTPNCGGGCSSCSGCN